MFLKLKNKILNQSLLTNVSFPDVHFLYHLPVNFNRPGVAVAVLRTPLSSLADPCEARGCSTNSLVIHSFIHSLSQPFPPTALQRRHAQTVKDSSSSYKIEYVIVIKNFLNLEGHQNPINDSKFTAILLKGWILSIGGASAVEGLRSTGLPSLV